MRSPITALSWDIWQRHRRLVCLLIGVVSFGWLLNLWGRDSIRAILADRFATGVPLLVGLLNQSLLAASFLLLLAIFSYTEFNPQTETIGFPHRLFVLPVTSFMLVAVPISLGIAAVELVLLPWVIFAHDLERANIELSAVLIGSYMVFYQTILWTLSRLRTLRIIVLGLIATILFGVGILRRFPGEHVAESGLIARIAGMAVLSFVTAWIYVARQRSGGGSRRAGLNALLERIADALPGRTEGFATPSSAQSWFEWRRSGLVLPLLIGVLLLVVIGPLSWNARNDPASTLRILVVSLAMPMVLALPVGKGFSKPDFWSADLSLPAFVAVRPLTTDDMVVIKMKVAALSASISWALVLAFLSVWLPLWANLESLITVQSAVSHFYHSVYAQYAIVVLSVVAGIFLTWRFLVAGLWIGLSGNRKLFAVSAAPYALAPLGFIAVLMLVRPNSPLRIWIRDDPDRLLSSFEWIVVVALIARFSLTAFFCRKIAPQRVRNYVLVWIGGTVCLIALAILLWSGMRHVLPPEAYGLRNILILMALLMIPFARLGLAPLSLAKNRHR